uniref:Krueppel-like factor 17 n=1 Tax=Sus scrofa TaxID=9823 RepID=A0A8D1Y710_PIG
MEQGAEGLSQWPVALHQLTEDTEKSLSILDMSSSPGSGGVHTSWNHGPSGTQQVPQCTELERMSLASAQAPRQNACEMGQQFSMSLPEHGVSYCSQMTFTASQMIYSQAMSPSQPGMGVFKGSQAMPLGEPSISSVGVTFSGNLSMPPSGLPVSPPSGIPMMSHNGMPTVPYSGLPTVFSNGDSLTPKMFLDPTMPSTEVQAVFPSLAQMLPSRDPQDFGMPPAGSPSLLALESQGSLASQPVSQEDFPKHRLCAPWTEAQNSRAQERASRRSSPISRLYHSKYENCGKAYMKCSHLVSHQRKHTGDRPYKCTWEACTWSFFHSLELGRHTRIHTRYRPHKCDQCSQQFMRSDHLRQHQRTHMQMPRSPDLKADNGHRAGPLPAPHL